MIEIINIILGIILIVLFIIAIGWIFLFMFLCGCYDDPNVDKFLVVRIINYLEKKWNV